MSEEVEMVGPVEVNGQKYIFRIGDKVQLIKRWRQAKIGATGTITSIGYHGLYLGKHGAHLRINYDKDNPSCNGKTPDRVGDGTPAHYCILLQNQKCIYCQGEIEYFDKYQVCTECFRVQE